MSKSIRQLATDLNVSHTAVRQAMQELGITGNSQGHGKPTLLNQQEQEAIAAKFYVPASVIQESQPVTQTGIVLRQSAHSLTVHQTQPLSLTVTDSTAQLTEAVKSLDNTLKQWMGNGQTLETALLQNSVMKGTELGTQMALAKVGSAVKASEAIELELAKKLGLVQDTYPAG